MTVNLTGIPFIHMPAFCAYISRNINKVMGYFAYRHDLHKLR